jgi:hypothetical protein
MFSTLLLSVLLSAASALDGRPGIPCPHPGPSPLSHAPDPGGGLLALPDGADEAIEESCEYEEEDNESACLLPCPFEVHDPRSFPLGLVGQAPHPSGGYRLRTARSPPPVA